MAARGSSPTVAPALESAPSDGQVVKGHIAWLREQGRQRRLRVQVPSLTLGACLTVVGAVLSGVYQPSPLALYASVAHFGGPWVMILAVLPTDTRSVHAIILFGIGASAAGVYFATAEAYVLLSALSAGQCHPDSAELADELERGCQLMRIDVARHLATAAIGLALILRLAYVGTRALSTRYKLEIAWRLANWGYIAWGLAFLAMYPVHVVLLRRAPLGAAALVYLVLGLETVLLGTLGLRPRFRERAQQWLASIGEGVSAAAGIAALLGGRDAEAVLGLARETFRAVPLDRLRREHLATNTPDPGAHALSEPAPLGGVDAFVSHSWHDDPDSKWEALQAWRQRFVGSNGREPRVWLDRVCIDQHRIGDYLPGLPVFLAGCTELLVLRGSTYLTRLWCCVELFVFYEMGSAQTERIVWLELAGVAPPPSRLSGGGGGEIAISAARLSGGGGGEPGGGGARPPRDELQFDVRHATAAVDSDREQLMAVIESSGGGYDRFNAWMRELLESGARSAAARAAALEAAQQQQSQCASLSPPSGRYSAAALATSAKQLVCSESAARRPAEQRHAEGGAAAADAGSVAVAGGASP